MEGPRNLEPRALPGPIPGARRSGPRSKGDRRRLLPLLVVVLATVGAGCGGGTTIAASPADEALALRVREAAHPITGASSDYDTLLARIGDARVVLLGEATHGTHEFYRERAEITRRLIEEHGFTAVAIEGDWPDAFRVNRYVRGTSTDGTVTAALAEFQKFPRWMWRNTDVRDFVEWMRRHNASAGEVQVGFYGLDVYSLLSSSAAVVEYLDRVDPAAAARARERYGCFSRYRDPMAYGQAVGRGETRSCATLAADQLREVEERGPIAGAGEEEAWFSAVRNARAVQGSEEYFRSTFVGNGSTWNIRDRFMMETLKALMTHLDRPGRPAKVVVWAHNSHVGDARSTYMADRGEINIGQLARERWGEEAALVGFTTYTGTVRAASAWGGPSAVKRVRPALPGSYGSVFHMTGTPDFLLLMDPARPVEGLDAGRLERAIGVLYLPQSERESHYFPAVLPAQFDAVLHFDETRAVEPLGR